MPDLLHLLDALNSVLLDAAGQPWVLLALLVCCTVDGVFPPVPSESLVVGLAALSAATGEPALWAVGVAATCGAVLGDNLAFGAGRRVGTDGFAWLRRPGPTRVLARATTALDRRSASFILTGRYVPVGWVAVNLAAGASPMPYRRFLPLSVLAGLSWAVFTMGIGALAGRWVTDNPLLGMALAITIALLVGMLLDRAVQWFSRRRRAAKPLPPCGPEQPGCGPEQQSPSESSADCSVGSFPIR